MLIKLDRNLKLIDSGISIMTMMFTTHHLVPNLKKKTGMDGWWTITTVGKWEMGFMESSIFGVFSEVEL